MVCTACLWGAMPLAIAAFTSVQPLSVNKLEPELQESLRGKGYSDTNVYFERGVYICLFEMERVNCVILKYRFLSKLKECYMMFIWRR